MRFFIDNVNQFLGLHLVLATIILPIGISFFTFQSMSYTIDVYRGELTPTRSVLKFFAYLALFPQLVAGPIVRARDFLRQLDEPRPVDEPSRYRGAELIVHGYFKKMVIADNLAPFVNTAFAAPAPIPSSAYWWLVMIAFAFQIYKFVCKAVELIAYFNRQRRKYWAAFLAAQTKEYIFLLCILYIIFKGVNIGLD